MLKLLGLIFESENDKLDMLLASPPRVAVIS
jgi:hypothetical protein